MGAPRMDSDLDLADLSERLFAELTSVRKRGWWRFEARDHPLLQQACDPAVDGEPAEAPIRRRLKELIDGSPPTDERGRPLPLENRDPKDRGLLGLLMFGEPGALTFSPGPNGETSWTIKPREVGVTQRYAFLETIRHEGRSTINHGPKPGRPRPGAGYTLLIELRDALLAELVPAAQEEPEAVPPVVRSSSHVRRTRIAAACVALATLAALAAGVQWPWDGDHREPPSFRPTPSNGAPLGSPVAESDEMAVNRPNNLAAGLRVANRSYDNRWGTRIRADPTDRLSFALTLENRAPVTSYPLVVWTEHSKSIDQRVRLVLAHADGTELFATPWVHVKGWSNQFEAFHVRGVPGRPRGRMLDEAGELVRAIPYPLSGGNVIPERLRPQFDRGLDDLALGRLESGQRVVVRFDGAWDLPYDAEFGTYPPSFHVAGTDKSAWLTTGSVKPGDRVTISILLDNQGSRESSGFVRVDFVPRKRGRYLRMRVLGSLWDDEMLIGTATINSSDGRPIEIVPEPGSTVLRGYRPGDWVYEEGCAFKSGRSRPKNVRRLEDGIAFGGVEIGSFGGFTPHGECAGIEFNEQIRFSARILAK
jgi:hypothetical protein